ncbi:hypothetical protein [Chromobacterium subtsugae]|uniref:hypothetical protein n=1 Tax=Chromobacterium subtsugae TaxID=251747 RepID=UPI0006416ADE|nr:hypothetical protein [Chromobacterium subtsugae]
MDKGNGQQGAEWQTLQEQLNGLSPQEKATLQANLRQLSEWLAAEPRPAGYGAGQGAAQMQGHIEQHLAAVRQQMARYTEHVAQQRPAVSPGAQPLMLGSGEQGRQLLRQLVREEIHGYLAELAATPEEGEKAPPLSH